MRRYFQSLSAIAFLSFACTAMAGDLGPTLQKIKDNGILSLGVRDDSVPFEYSLGGGQETGYSYDVAMAVVAAVKHELNMPNLQVKEILVTSQNRIPLLMNSSIDLECGTTTNNVERQKQVAFSTSIFVIGTKLLVNKSSGVKEWADLKGKNVVTLAGSTDERLLRDMNDKQNLQMNVVSVKNVGEAFLMVQMGRAAAYMDDDAILYAERAKSSSPKDWDVVAKPYTREAYGCMLRRDDPQFKRLVDGVIADMMKNGSLTNIYNKWFMQPVPPKGFNVNFPMSADMKALFASPNDKALDD